MFKIGDRVKERSTGDTGVIVTEATNLADDPPGFRWYVRWDADGRELTIHESMMEMEHPAGLSVEKAIDFLVSKGYTVSKGPQ